MYTLHWHKSLVVALLSLLMCSQVQARPKIGLALGGGGAKGSAHIGVLKVLEQHNIPVDYIAGTSIGSVVGGMYALGLNADEIEKIMLQTHWDAGYSDAIPREKLPWRVKQQSDQFNIPLAVGIRDGKLRMPSGILQGQTMSALLRQAIGVQPNFNSFDELATPYRAIATDLANNKAVIMDSGSLISAMQASSSVPGALAPTQQGDLLLVDGGITKNIPIDVVRKMGADIIIAIDIGNDLRSREELEGTFAVLGQLSAFLTTANSEEQKAQLDKVDILIRPDISGLSTTDWSVLEEALKRGTDAADQQLAKLETLSIDKQSYQNYRQQRQQRHAELMERAVQPIKSTRINQQTPVHEDLIFEKLSLRSGETLDAQTLNNSVDRLYSIDEFQRVNAETLIEDEQVVLEVTPQHKSWGPNYLEFGLGWEDDFSINSDLNFDIAYTMRDLTRNGGEWRNQLELGAQRAVHSEFYLPLDTRRRYYSSSHYDYSAYEWDLFLENSPLVAIEQQSHVVEQGLGFNYTQPGFSEIGLTTETGELRNKFFLDEDIEYLAYGAYFKLGFDNLDSISFPTKGHFFSIDTYLRKEDTDEHPIINREPGVDKINSLHLDINWKTAINLGNHAIVVKASYAEVITKADNDSVYLAHLGGFLNLSGYHRNALTGAKKTLAAGVYQYDLGRSLLDLEQFPLYLGLSLESGNVWAADENIHHDDLITAGCIYLGTDTKLGPVALAFGKTDTDQHSFYFYLGKNF